MNTDQRGLKTIDLSVFIGFYRRLKIVFLHSFIILPERGAIEKIMQRGGNRRRCSVFSDLGFKPAEAENLRIRSAMMRALVGFIRDNKLTQARAAELLGVTQPRISDLMRGKIDLFSIDSLVNLLAAVGLRVDVRVKSVA
jgi:predicted XRE-type DNA-binding protein